jgi:hypothetical protein
VSPLCSAEKQQQYRNLVKSLTFAISVVQVVMLIVELGIGGEKRMKERERDRER